MTSLAQGWVLRFRFQGKVTSIADNLIGPCTNFLQLKELLTSEGRICYGISPSQLQLRGGFPPRVIRLNDDDLLSKQSLIRNKDMLHVELVDNSGNRIPIASSAGHTKCNDNNNNKYINIGNLKTLTSSPMTSSANGGKFNGGNQTTPLRRSSRERKPSKRQ